MSSASWRSVRDHVLGSWPGARAFSASRLFCLHGRRGIYLAPSRRLLCLDSRRSQRVSPQPLSLYRHRSVLRSPGGISPWAHLIPISLFARPHRPLAHQARHHPALFWAASLLARFFHLTHHCCFAPLSARAPNETFSYRSWRRVGYSRLCCRGLQVRLSPRSRRGMVYSFERRLRARRGGGRCCHPRRRSRLRRGFLFSSQSP